jgi:beta-glucosidase/6-phospho-beta-glucosidase/beta-galactosidase
MRPFAFATGIEASCPNVLLADGRTVRVDEYEKTGHYDRWRDDFALVKELDLDVLRYGPPYHRTHVGPGTYDWCFADETFAELKRLGITPLVDLCHFGIPDWLGDFQNPEWPRHFAEYARAFAHRYPWTRFFTPVNEIFITATFSAQNGWWNECLTGDRSFVTALKHLSQANVLAMRAIVGARQHDGAPEPVFVQSESSEYFHAAHPDCVSQAQRLNERRFLALDLTYGYPVSVGTYQYLLEHGMTDAEYHWFARHHVPAHCVMGTDYYATNEHVVHADGSLSPAGDIFGYYVLTRQYYNRYRLPVMHTETNVAEPRSREWLWKQWANIVRLKQDGVPVVGFTWYSLVDQVDWDTSLREDNGRVNSLGLYDLQRKLRPVGEAYGKIVKEWRTIMCTNNLLLKIGY